MNTKDVISKEDFKDFLFRNLTTSQLESILLKYLIKQNIEMYTEFGNSIQNAIRIMTQVGFQINEKKVFFTHETIHRYYYELK